MADSLKLETKSAISIQEEEDRKTQNPILSILNNFHFFNFPQFNKPTESKVVYTKEEEAVSKVEAESNTQKKPGFVRVPDGKKDFPRLRLEGDESQEAASGPRNMWQVYALGGFMLGRWLWARWNERKADESNKQQPSGDDEPPPSVDN